MIFNFVVFSDYENISTTKISGFTVILYTCIATNTIPYLTSKFNGYNNNFYIPIMGKSVVGGAIDCDMDGISDCEVGGASGSEVDMGEIVAFDVTSEVEFDAMSGKFC